MGILIPILGIIAGIVAIGCNYAYKIERLRLEHGREEDASGPRGGRKLDRVLKENEELRRRVENLEVIVDDMSRLGPAPSEEARRHESV